MPGDDDVDLAAGHRGHHLGELWPRLAVGGRHVVVDVLAGHGPAAGRYEPKHVLALAVDAKLITVSILRLPQVERDSRVFR